MATVNASTEQISAVLSKTSELFAKRDDIANLRSAAASLGTLRVPGERNFEVEWQYSRINYFLGLASTEEKEKMTAFERGRDAGKIAANMHGDKAAGHFWYGANLGELARLSPVTVGLSSVDDIKAAMNRVIEIDPRYQNTAAYDVLAQVELGTQMFGGSAEKAAELLEKAVALEKDNVQVRLHLGQAYLASKRYKEARRELETVMSMPPDPEYVPEHNVATAEAARLIRTKF